MDVVRGAACVYAELVGIVLSSLTVVSGKPRLRLLGFLMDTQVNLLSGLTSVLLCPLQFVLCP